MLGSTEGRETEEATGVAEAIDALLALDPDTLDDRELAELAVAMHRQQSRLAAATTRVTAALDARGGGGGGPAAAGYRSARPGPGSVWGDGCPPCPSPGPLWGRGTSPPATP